MSTFIGAVQGTDNLALATGYGILDREFRRELGLKFPKYRTLSILRQLEGRLAPMTRTKEHVHYYYEEGDWFNANVVIGTAAADGSNIVVTLDADSHQDNGKKSYPIPGDLCVFEDETVGYVNAKNTDVDGAHTVTIKPVNSDQDVITAAIPGSTITFYGTVFGEASDTPQSRVPAVTKISNQIHTNRASYEITDWSTQNEVEFEYNGQKFLYVKGLEELEERFSINEELNMIITPAAENLTDASGNALKTTSGLIPQIGEGGQNTEYFDEPDLAYYQDMVLTIDANHGDDTYFVGQGRPAALMNDNWVIEFAKNGDNGVNYSAFGGREQALSFNLKFISLGGVTFSFDTWAILSHRGSLGSGDMHYPYMQIGIPMGNGLDENRNSVPYLRIMYSTPLGAPHEVQGDVKVFEHGGASKRGATNGVQKRIVEMISYKSLEMRCREKFWIGRKGNM